MNALPTLFQTPTTIQPLDGRAQRIRDLVGTARLCIIEIGRELIAAKEECEHGDWLPWLDREFGWSEATAKNYMNVARAFKSPTISDLNFSIDATALYALSAPGVPQSARDEAVETAKTDVVTKAKAEEMIEEATKKAVQKAITEAQKNHEQVLEDKIAEATEELADDKKALKKKLAEIEKQYKGEPGIPIYLAVTARALGVKNLSASHYQLVAQLLNKHIVVGDKVRYSPISKEQQAQADEHMRITSEIYQAFEALAAAPDAGEMLAVCFPIQRRNIRVRMDAVLNWLSSCQRALESFDPNEPV